MEIKRDQYLQKLISKMHNSMIKVITGMRRSGKSYLLFHIFRDYLLEEGVKASHIISIEFDRIENIEYRDGITAYNYIKSLIVDDENYYIFLDEVQMMNNFEDVLNSLLHIKNVDTYVTGSNSKFLSKDVITEFRGRGDEIHVYPLSYAEFMSQYKGDRYEGWNEYMIYGGLPYVALLNSDKEKSDYLLKLFKEIYIRDIMERYKIEKVEELNELINILASAVGSLTNPTKILATFKSVLHSDISINTIRTYIEYLKDAFIISEVSRFDVKGRKYIGTPFKYYFEDVGLRNAALGFRQIEESHIMENVLYNELKLRGYSVDVGVVKKRYMQEGKNKEKQLEIDFICNQGSKRYYIQSALNMDSKSKEEQEKLSLKSVDDSFKKIVVVKDYMKVNRDNDGINIMGIYNFLLDKDSLDL
ncbi:MAG: ATP-binding protein [Lachnospiraceae bacterium]|jgi:predicted AAA+ superfamily ATPase|nr:ATP-binding protein [Lachnospiraceae bacterium]